MAVPVNEPEEKFEQSKTEHKQFQQIQIDKHTLSLLCSEEQRKTQNKLKKKLKFHHKDHNFEQEMKTHFSRAT